MEGGQREEGRMERGGRTERGRRTEDGGRTERGEAQIFSNQSSTKSYKINVAHN